MAPSFKLGHCAIKRLQEKAKKATQKREYCVGGERTTFLFGARKSADKQHVCCVKAHDVYKKRNCTTLENNVANHACIFWLPSPHFSTISNRREHITTLQLHMHVMM